MIQKKTAFIIGAGAHCPYGMPTGKVLKDKIIALKNEAHKYGNLGIPEYDRIMFINFCDTFQKSNISSIDKFLELNPRFLIYGKLAICIIIQEQENYNYQKTLKDEWIQYTINRLICSVNGANDIDAMKFNNLYFCTFNYDRLLDWTIATSLLNSFGENAIVNRSYQDYGYKGLFDLFHITIDHVYGKIGKPDDYDIEHSSYYDIPQYLNEILLINERERNISIINDRISLMNRVLFLGYGFNEENNRILNLAQILQGKESYATGIGVILEEKERIETEVPCKVEIDSDSHTLLRKYLV